MKRTLSCTTPWQNWQGYLKQSLMMVAGGILITGCAVLPSTATQSKSRWVDYEEARKSYDTVKIDETTRKDLKAIGFTPDGNSNVRILNYVDVGNLFGSAFRYEDLPTGVRTCVSAQDACLAYVVNVRRVNNKRNGNVAADLFGFKKHTDITGWEFQATVVLVNDRVVYKLWNGTPDIASSESQSTPLGPMQNLSGIIPKPGF
ncbi:MAG: hypothetical protein DI628_07730 [Blastochloris viridis]|uniref:Uncharacterized protein n=1 Tax=Blastochloris viridis TaxID=1079 RepID=A0A6N4R563_BLAVI|nr:MAG: hypothetical protein DI628_07730 [Blastochloris viridis]